MDEIDKQIANARRGAQAKMKRIYSKQRYNIAQSVNNPIAPTQHVEAMSTRQKRTYLAKLKKFNSRSTVFHIDANGRPISSSAWQRYKQAEAVANKYVNDDIHKYRNLHGPEGPNGMTIKQRMELMKKRTGKLMVNPSGSNMHEVNRKSTGIDSERALKRLTKSQVDKANPAKQAKKLREGRKQFEKMAAMSGNKKMIALGKKLTDEQFKVLWNYTDFATAVSLKYEVYQQSLVSEKAFHKGAMANADRKAYEFLEWASKI